MNWQETRNRLTKIDSKFEELPLEWRPQISLIDANLRGANLRGVNLRYADLIDANLIGADLCDANLRDANLRGADLRGADLCGANLSGADLRGADLRDADLRGADLSGANLYWANLRGANLSGANLIDAKNIIVIQFDNRGYQLVCWRLQSKPMFNAGCHSFTYDDALAHWGSSEYEDQKRGQQYVKAVKFLAEFATNAWY